VKSVVVRLEDRPAWVTPPGRLGDPITVPALGIAYQVVPAITEEPAPDAPAARAGLHKGDRVYQAVVIVPSDKPEKNRPKIPIAEEKPGLPFLFWILQLDRLAEVKFEVKRGDATPNIEPFSPAPNPDWPAPFRGIGLIPLSRHLPPQKLGASLVLGYKETRSTIAKLYLILRRLIFSRTVPPKTLTGPVGIVVYGYHEASTSFPVLIKFLALLSINLAIINFLPIPVLDGGHMIFLTWEWVRGKPASERVLVIANYCGLILILTLVVLITGHDIYRLIR